VFKFLASNFKKSDHLKFNFYFYPLLFIMGLLISYLTSFHAYTINPDGVLYLQTAYVATHKGVQAAFSIYAWPFYSLIIAYIAHFFHLSLIHSAHILNSIFQAMLPVVFCLLIREIDSRPKVLIWAALLILSWGELNGYRDYIIRDFGYWLFFLTSLLGFVRCSKRYSFFNILIYYIGFAIAFLFRVEALLLLLIPASIFFFNEISMKKKIFLLLKIYSVFIVIGLITIFLLWRYKDILSMSRLSELQNILFHGKNQMVAAFTYLVTPLQNNILTPDSERNAPYFVFWGLFGFWIQQTILGVGIFNWALFIYSHYFKLGVADNSILQLKNQRKNIFIIFYTVIIFYLFMGLFFIFKEYFLVKRYFFILALIVMMWGALALNDLWQKWRILSKDSGAKRYIFLVVFVYILLQFLSSLISFGPSNFFVKQGADWLVRTIPSESRLCTNERYILFAVKGPTADFVSDLGYTPEQFKKHEILHCDYYAIQINRHKLASVEEINNALQRKPIKVFSNRHGDTLFIYGK
jgi:hypothetical protein